mmetsp:Transcript_27484/g.53757  ORF Transcript_27484/g.53757 Transcript_27484/m.53757 type:complete len:96 (+) Transcript_27484:415-702(+)
MASASQECEHSAKAKEGTERARNSTETTQQSLVASHHPNYCGIAHRHDDKQAEDPQRQEVGVGERVLSPNDDKASKQAHYYAQRSEDRLRRLQHL